MRDYSLFEDEARLAEWVGPGEAHGAWARGRGCHPCGLPVVAASRPMTSPARKCSKGDSRGRGGRLLRSIARRGVVSGDGSAHTFFDNLLEGKCGIGPLTRFDSEKHAVKISSRA